MNNTTYTANENCFLIDGEVYIFQIRKPKILDYVHLKENKMLIRVKDGKWLKGITEEYPIVTHSTKLLDGVKLLPRDKFVKPVDVDNLYNDWTEQSHNYDELGDGIKLFKAGYNANKGEFTRDEMIKAMNAAYNYPLTCIELLQEDKFEEERDRIINSLRPLSLPESVEINEQGEIVNVIWI